MIDFISTSDEDCVTESPVRIQGGDWDGWLGTITAYTGGHHTPIKLANGLVIDFVPFSSLQIVEREQITALDVLRGAPQVIRERGWHKGMFFDEAAHDAGVPLERCPVCMLGAMNLAGGENVDSFFSGAVEIALGWVYKALEPFGAKSAHEWNDAPERTVDEVLAVLTAAAALAEDKPEGEA